MQVPKGKDGYFSGVTASLKTQSAAVSRAEILLKGAQVVRVLESPRSSHPRLRTRREHKSFLDSATEALTHAHSNEAISNTDSEFSSELTRDGWNLVQMGLREVQSPPPIVSDATASLKK